MEFKPDWEQAKERFLQFWNNENEERALLAVTAPNRFFDRQKYYETYDVERFDDTDTESICHWWCDTEENVRRNEYIFSTTFFGGEALPIAFTNWGAMAMCSFYGCQPVFNKKSVWYHKVIEDWSQWKWQRQDNEYLKATFDITRAFAENGAGRYFAGMPELGSAGDLLSLMRGMDDLCLDVYDEPEAFHQAVDFLTREFLDLQDQLWPILTPTSDGGSTLPWMSLWMPGRGGNQLACDFSWVISNETFREFFFKELQAEGRWNDYATYHLDGPQCMKTHLDSLLTLPEIKAIEWTPGAGCPPASTPEYLPRYRQILESGKKLVLVADPEEIDFLTANLPPQGVFIKTTAASEEDAKALLKIAERNAANWRKEHKGGTL